jgi:hypothetical protein
MVRKHVRSSMIEAWAFDRSSSILEIEFKNGRVYQYAKVPEFLAKGFAASHSKGLFFRSRIADRYKAEEVPPR